MRFLSNFFILVLTIFVSTYAFCKCKGFDDFRPHYCVKIKAKSKIETFENGCVFEYELIKKTAAEPVRREYPYWQKKFNAEESVHTIKADTEICDQVKKKSEGEVYGISSQRCYDMISLEDEFLNWIKGVFGFKDVKPNFQISKRDKIVFHDKGELEVFCSEDFKR